MPRLYAPPMPRSFAVVVSMDLALVAGLALIFVATPGNMAGTVTPWDFVSLWVMTAMAGNLDALVVVGLAGLTAGAILVATVWLSRNVADDRLG